MGEEVVVADYINYVFDYIFCSLKVSNNIIFKWVDCFYIFVCFFVYLYGFVVNGNRFIGMVVFCNNRGFIYDDFIVLNDKCIGSIKVNSKFLGKKVEEFY